jgi:hypothetical protein
MGAQLFFQVLIPRVAALPDFTPIPHSGAP